MARPSCGRPYAPPRASQGGTGLDRPLFIVVGATKLSFADRHEYDGQGNSGEMPYCRRCGAEIATANLLDIEPGVDRAHFALVTPGGWEQLPPFEWRLFEALYQRHGRIVCVGELATAVGLAEDAVRSGVCRLRRLLTCSRFRIIMHRGYGYELIAMREEPSAVTHTIR